MNIDFAYLLKVFPQVLLYLPTTLLLAVVSMIFAMILGLVLALLRESKITVLVKVIEFYISLFRGIPSLVQLFIIYFGLPQLFPALSDLTAMSAAIIGFSLKTSAYMAEIFRAALASVDWGQTEAGLSIGMNRSQIYRRIVLPQAMLNALPATGNTFISLIKDTSVAFALGVSELFAEGKMIAAESLRFFETFLVVGLIYWLVIIVYSRLQNWLEKKLNHSLQR
ncbi:MULTISPECIES: amino acid ABC transporter permease [Symbiopectobacterium]|uniref:Amino acid ABC transporter permease n=1 Tax=Symbiopectobacterium purcellii TaxID=2871826 RepID=A0ABX9ASI2_9ENTR|nr:MULTISPECIES: amino acid ABC transporter permease [Symbiopectobacterium]MCW2476853.1 amino acid ABC transporter permease [Candidatus Symbiopectobacterium sp. NZEC151]MCW2479060.1 amino acid ABC transporter permease [Candidatus Symbiopectobacterium sp. NZEC135]MCW2488223.1 amino acid ABC transporter permease [Candidatus Symbiopectobacterium sp. NZEC127]QZN98207.1 amino acid ABC transporter permease [Symbiopectobacterium purcellii]